MNEVHSNCPGFATVSSFPEPEPIVIKIEATLPPIQPDDVPISVLLKRLLTPEFVQRHTSFPSIGELVRAGGPLTEDAAGNRQFDDFIAANTRFRNFRHLVDEAFAKMMDEYLQD